jgi:hypothetical protein
MSADAIYGVLAEFRTADALLEATTRAREARVGPLEAYTPFPVEGLSEALGFEKNHVPLYTLLGGLAGGIGTYFMQWYAAVISYPLNIGGRPLHSWPAFIPPTFEITVLGAAFAAVIGMLIANGLPRLRHPLFDVPDFDLATRNRFFLCIRTSDASAARAFLAGLDPLLVREVPA